MASLALIGRNISYSQSPKIYNELAEKSGINLNYNVFDIQSIKEVVHIINTHSDLIGFNVTIPYKTEIIEILDSISDDVREINAVNCVLIDKNKKLSGYNTDWKAFRDTFVNIKKDFHNKAIILGSGGAAKAVAYALKSLNIDYLVVVRDVNKIASDKMISYDDVKNLDYSEYNIIINATPCGTLGTNFDLKDLFPFDLIKENSLMYDLVYEPIITPFIQEGIKRNCFVKNGLDMLRLQAEYAWEIFLPQINLRH